MRYHERPMSPHLPSNRRTTTRLYRAARIVGAAAGVVIALTIAGILWLLRDQRPYWESRRSAIGAVSADTTDHPSGDRIELVELTAASGLVVELAVRHPTPSAPNANARGQRPLVLLL